ncbi:MAG: sigma-70 family RNA polymerase sigma factor [Flavobacteriales bacterium]|jgi:RNA polymerase sigma factor (sigma-70 family)|nr:sigma-70 family RNA polymerase sigma factor [Flavobacteriales bacterium]|tara:strand:- start:4842 stop:5426 length:585 start_codon:yes stop_codon:yes gene_type:complete
MLLSNLSDQELVKEYINGDNFSFEILLHRHKNRVFAFIMSKIKNKDISEDIFQDTYVKVVNSLQKGKYNEEGKFLPWVMRISHNLVIDHFRKQKKMHMIRSNSDFDIFDVIKDNEINIDEKLIKDQVYYDLKSLIELLPTDQKEVLKMRYFEELSFKKIAQTIDVSINTALGRMRYALINLRGLSKKHHVDLHI